MQLRARLHRPLARSAARLAAALAAGSTIALGATVSAGAQANLGDKQAQAQAILVEIQHLDEDVGAAAERWNGANLELQSLTSELAETRESLERARRLYRMSQARIAQRLRDLYVRGEPDSTLDVLLGARSLDEVITGLEATRRIAAQDAAIAREAGAYRKRVRQQEDELTEARARQAEIVDGLTAEKRAIEEKLAARERLLSSVKDEIARLEEIERRRQSELRQQAAIELERQRREAATAAAAQSSAQQVAPAPDGDGGSNVPQEIPEYAPPPPNTSKGAQVVAIAMQYLGIPYKWGGASPSTGFDCSGLTMYVYAQVGVSLPHYAAAQYQLGSPVAKGDLALGDLVFFRSLGHMGMYIGGGNFIHAPRTGDVVKISSLSEPYYIANWVGARRVL